MKTTTLRDFCVAEELITPQLAEALLLLNTSNRRVTPALVKAYSHVMSTGGWRQNGEPIQVSSTNKLLNGQHRLLVVIDSQTTQPFLVVRGLPDDVFDTLDVGKRRSIGDVLSIRGFENTASLGAALNFLYRYLNGSMHVKGGTKAAFTELEKLLETFPQLHESVSRAGKARNKLISPSLMAVLHMLGSQQDPELAEVFVQGVEAGFDPGMYLNFARFREVLIKNATARAKYPVHIIAAVAIKAWNATLQGRVIHKLYFGVDEAFPLFITKSAKL